MGLCASQSASEGVTTSRDIDKNNKVDEMAAKRTKKLLLLGAGESGKSTLFKQMITLYGKGFSDEDRKQYAHVVYNNAVESMLELLAQTEKLRDELAAQGESTALSEDLADAKATVQNATVAVMAHAFADIEQSEKQAVGKAIQQLWEDKGIQTVYAHRSKFQLLDSAKYYFENMHRIVQPDFVPTVQDVLRTRVRTTGIVETQFNVNNNDFVMFDVGGQRNERKKWIHCFENCTAVIFVAAISEYDQVLFEDERTNRIWEALQLFNEISNSRWFRNTTVILFLNKRDLFEDKIKKVPLTVCFPEFPGPQLEYEPAAQYMQQQFEAEHKNKNKPIYAHITCATDTDNIRFVFDVVAGVIIREKLEEVGLL
ncbi:MAG: hypothetical protein MHM6MM_004476 [Cercozoa sp. M6MM]